MTENQARQTKSYFWSAQLSSPNEQTGQLRTSHDILRLARVNQYRRRCAILVPQLAIESLPMRSCRAFCAILVLFLSCDLPSTTATTIVPLSWKELVYNSDFIGVVQCVTAGGIVAEYQVVESWKGPPQGTRLRIRTAVNYWEPQFPIALVGEKFLVTAFKAHDPTILTSTSSGGPVPLWWRQIPADYSLPLFQGSARLPLRGSNRPLGSLGSERTDIGSFKKDAQEFLALSPAQQELSVLKGLPTPRPHSASTAQNSGEDLTLKLNHASSVDEYVSTLIAFEAGESEDQGMIRYTLIRFGGAETLKALQNERIETSALKPAVRKEIIEGIQRRLDGLSAGEGSDTEKSNHEDTPSQESLDEMRRVLLGHPTDEQLYEVFEPMTRYDPDPVVDYLVHWVNRGKDWSDHDLGYALGSYFARNCIQNRKENLTKLLQAKDKLIRVAGAVYLTFEDHGEGVNHLKRLSELPGDAGAWAALVLAERGEKSAVPRAIEVFSTFGETNMASVPHRNLQKRLLVLLSNSAGSSGIAQPSPPLSESNAETEAELPKSQTKQYEYFRSWWNTNQKKITISNPWAEILEKQKID